MPTRFHDAGTLVTRSPAETGPIKPANAYELRKSGPAPGIGGDRRPPVQHPLVANLFFTGDTVTQTDVGTNGAAHGAILCANAVTGRDFLPLPPDYLR